MTVAETIKDNRYRVQKPMPVLAASVPVRMEMTVDNGPIGHLVISVRDSNDKDLFSAGVGAEGIALSTGETGSAIFDFDPAKLAGARYVLWNMWASYEGPRPLQFTVTVTATQGAVSFKSTIKVQMAAEEKIVRISNNGDFLAIGKAYP